MAILNPKAPGMHPLHECAQAVYESECILFRRKLREHNCFRRASMDCMDSGQEADHERSAFLKSILHSWRWVVHTRPRRREVQQRVYRPVVPKAPEREGQSDDFLNASAPIRFSRGLRRVELETASESDVSSTTWRRGAQHGRLDIWKTTESPRWLTAVREEIPNQLMVLKAEARGDA